MASNCPWVSSYGSVMPRLGLGLGQVQRCIGDLNRVVWHRDASRVLLAVQDSTTSFGAGAEVLGVVEQHVRAER